MRNSPSFPRLSEGAFNFPKHFFKAEYWLIVTIALFINHSPRAGAIIQDNVWQYVETKGGVIVSWRWRKELKDQYISEFKFENQNFNKVEIDFTPVFVCSDYQEVPEGRMNMTIDGYKTKFGQGSGLFFYPCNGTLPPIRGKCKDLQIKPWNAD